MAKESSSELVMDRFASLDIDLGFLQERSPPFAVLVALCVFAK